MKRNADRPNSTPDSELLPLTSHGALAHRRAVLQGWVARASLVELDAAIALVAAMPSAEADVVAFPTERA